MKAALLTIGEEILIGQIVDTNSAWIANELNSIGIQVHQILSISDSNKDIQESISKFFKEHDIIIATGGLGPTRDDITKQALCELFNTELTLHSETLVHIENIFKRRGLPLTELNRRQAEVPASCNVLFNPSGTAPGMWFDNNGKVLVVLPGVPFEMKDIMSLHVLPMIKQRASGKIIIHKTIQTFGLPESFLAEKLSDWEENMPNEIKVAYLPSPISIRIRLSSTGDSEVEIKQKIYKQINTLKSIIPSNIFGYDNDSMSSVVGKLLLQHNKTLAVAESCTGGNICHQITQNSGSSGYFIGGMVAYSNGIKVNELGVAKSTLEKHGAVSKETVESMAKAIREKYNASYGIATSGIAGPTGATPGKPVGTIWIAVSSDKTMQSEVFQFGGNRERNITRSTATALNMLRLLIIEEMKSDVF
ncbi:MAG: competence/damage-inducible protein A [Bacteroidales bacterium]